MRLRAILTEHVADSDHAGQGDLLQRLGRKFDLRDLPRLIGNRAVSAALTHTSEPRVLEEDALRPRVHSGPLAQFASLRIGARAFTIGHDIFIGPGSCAPGTPLGNEVLRHELVHVRQRTSGLPNDAAAAESEAVRGEVRPAHAGESVSLQAGNWREDVRAAMAIGDSDRRAAALFALTQRALDGTGIHVTLAGNNSPAQVRPEDYQSVPVVNFDPLLNEKRSWPAGSEQRTRSLASNVGYTFNHGRDVYSIIGPRSINENSPLYVQMAAEHELFHAGSHHGNAPGARASDTDQELEAWTRDFRSYFHRLYTFRQQWLPLIMYYENASVDARRAALGQLIDYYRTPPVAESERDSIRTAFGNWLRRRLNDSEDRARRLVTDLAAALEIRGR